MIKLIVRRFVKNSENVSDPDVRKSYGVLGGAIGIICNVLLFLIKLAVGMMSGSIAIISDAFNNLSDCGTSIVSVIGAYVGGKGADKEHPYGHGRAEYIAALIIAFFIVIVGVELMEKSIRGILNPENIKAGAVTITVLVISVIVKVWMWYFYRYMGRRVESSILLAAAKDSLNDTVSTTVVILSSVVALYVDFPVDAVAGLMVSVMIIWSGVGVARDITDRLLGRAPSEKLIKEIENMVLGGEFVLGMHDLMVHDYGPGIKIASVHAEVPDNLSVTQVHNKIDEIEHRILNELGVDIVIHMDPVKKR